MTEQALLTLLWQGLPVTLRPSAPVGGGVAQTIAVTSGGIANFTIPGVALTFPASGTYPNGNVVVSRLNVPSDQPASFYTIPTAPKGYFIVRNYGTNATFSSLSSIKFSSITGTTAYAVANPGTLKLYKRLSNDDGATWGSSIDDADVVTNSGGNGTVEFSTNLSNTSFSQFAIGSTSNPLPIGALSLFTAKKQDDFRALLEWKVDREADVRDYSVERSDDGSKFTQLGVRIASGAGAYSYNDDYPLDGNNYYRLKLNYLNEKSDYSNIRTLNFGRKAALIVQPNPSQNGIVTFSLQGLRGKTDGELTVTDAQGKIVKSLTISGMENGVPHTTFLGASGLYFLQLKLSGGAIYSQRVVVVD